MKTQKYFFKNGDTYEGEMNSSQELQGYGEYQYSDGSYYKGQFIRGKFNGKGLYYDNNSKTTFEGEFMNSKPNGNIQIKYSDNSTYKGQILNGLKQGIGTFNFPPNNRAKLVKYIGEFQRDFFEGQGKFEFENGISYAGQVREGKMEGKGTFTHPNYEYTGYFKEGQKSDTNGVQNFTNGDIYSGNFLYDKRNGEGKMKYKDGSVYTGDWYDDQKHGNGKLEFSHGEIYEGQFLKGQFHGKGKYIFSKTELEQTNQIKDSDSEIIQNIKKINNSVHFYQGEFQNGFAEGEGKIIFHNSSNYLEGQFSQNAKHGICKLYIFKGEQKEIFGTFTGQFIQNIENTSLSDYGPRK